MKAEILWEQFCRETGTDIDTPHEAWAFGGEPDQLADLVLKGIKTATASGYDLYFLEGETEPLPAVGDYSIVLNSKEEALCVIRTTAVNVVPFDEVGSAHAYKEGEGDRSLAYWRAVHKDFFEKDFKSCNAVFSEKSRILCEEFELLYKA